MIHILMLISSLFNKKYIIRFIFSVNRVFTEKKYLLRYSIDFRYS